MSQQRAKRLQPLIHIAEKSVQEALSYIGLIQQRIDGETVKKQSLLDYQKEYMANFQRSGSQGMSGLQLQQFESFIQQIDNALSRQVQQVMQFQQQLEQAQRVYLQLNQRLKSYQKLQGRISDKATAQQDRQLQSFLDEIGAQLHRLNQHR